MKKSSTEPSIPMTRPQIISLLQRLPDLAHKILKMLPHREAHVLSSLYGLNGTGLRRPVDLAREMGISISRIYQLRTKAIRLVCHHNRKRVIVQYIIVNMIKPSPDKDNQKNLHGVEEG